MLIPNLKTKFKKSVPLKSYSKKTIKKQLVYNGNTLSADSNCPRTYLSEDVPVHGYFSQLQVRPRTVIVHGRYVRRQ